MNTKAVGDRIGDFTVLEAFHNGNFSCVFKVRNDENEIFALKTIQYSKIESKEERESLIESAKRETQIGIMSGISSPFLVKYYKIFNDGATFCILMEFCGGGMLEDRIQRRKDETRFFSEEEVLDVIYQLTSGLHELRQKNVIHRDLKTENIFVGNDGNLKIGDYGVGKVIETQSSLTHTQVGTPYYMSPEILLGKTYSFQCDVWSLGVLAYYMMTYEYPFLANTYLDLVNVITKGTYRPITNSSYSNELKTLIGQMLVLNPDKRITTSGILEQKIFEKYLRHYINSDILEVLEKKKISMAALIRDVDLVNYLKWYTLTYSDEDVPPEAEVKKLSKMIGDMGARAAKK